MLEFSLRLYGGVFLWSKLKFSFSFECKLREYNTRQA